MGDLEPLGGRGDRRQRLAGRRLSISANDIVHWLGRSSPMATCPANAPVQRGAVAQMWNPTVLLPINLLPAEHAHAAVQHLCARLNVREYRGARVSCMPAASAAAGDGSDPDRNVGFYIAVNNEDSCLRHLTYGSSTIISACRRAAGRSSTTSSSSASGRPRRSQAPGPSRRVGPSVPLANYAGRYTDPWFGTINIRTQGRGLAVDFPHWPGLTATLEHWQYDTFKMRLSDPVAEPAFVTFALGADGKVARITMAPVSPIADFSYDYRDLEFTPAAAGTAAP